MELPRYSSQMYGDPTNIIWSANVQLGNQNYQSQETCTSKKTAEESAAKSAWAAVESVVASPRASPSASLASRSSLSLSPIAEYPYKNHTKYAAVTEIFIIVDLENLQPDISYLNNLSILNTPVETYFVYSSFTSVNKNYLSSLSTTSIKSFVTDDSSNNAADFAIAFVAGRLIKSAKPTSMFILVSRDKSIASVAKLIVQQSVACIHCKSTEEFHILLAEIYSETIQFD